MANSKANIRHWRAVVDALNEARAAVDLGPYSYKRAARYCPAQHQGKAARVDYIRAWTAMYEYLATFIDKLPSELTAEKIDAAFQAMPGPKDPFQYRAYLEEVRKGAAWWRRLGRWAWGALTWPRRTWTDGRARRALEAPKERDGR